MQQTATKSKFDIFDCIEFELQSCFATQNQTIKRFIIIIQRECSAISIFISN